MLGAALVVGLVSFGIHSVLGLRLMAPFELEGAAHLAGWGAVAASAAILPLTFVLMPRSGTPWADAIQWVGYLWMGVFSLIFAFVLFRDLGWFAAGALGLLPDDLDVRRILLGRLNLGVLALSAAVSLAAFGGSRRAARVVRVSLPIDGRPDALDGFRIAQISDLHVGPTIRAAHMQEVVDRVNGLEADLVALTGDLVDGGVRQLAPHVAPLRDLESRHGTWFVTGNHEYYSGVHQWVDHVRGPLGMNVLLDEHAVLDHDGSSLLVAGITDRTAKTMVPTHTGDVHQAAAGAPETDVRLLLAHQPEAAPAAAELGFHVQLSGHTHGGQYIPFAWIIRMVKRWVKGLYNHEGTWVYVNPGTTWWGPPMRLGSPQEITLLELTRA